MAKHRSLAWAGSPGRQSALPPLLSKGIAVVATAVILGLLGMSEGLDDPLASVAQIDGSAQQISADRSSPVGPTALPPTGAVTVAAAPTVLAQPRNEALDRSPSHATAQPDRPPHGHGEKAKRRGPVPKKP